MAGAGFDPVALARRAQAAGMQPVAVRVQAVLNMLIGNLDFIVLAELPGALPGFTFKLNEFVVARIFGVHKQAMGNFMEQRPERSFVINGMFFV